MYDGAMNRRQEWPTDRDKSPFEGPEDRRFDRLFAAQSKARRPHMLQCLTKTLGPLTVLELAGRVAQDDRDSNTVEPPLRASATTTYPSTRLTSRNSSRRAWWNTIQNRVEFVSRTESAVQTSRASLN